MNDLFVWYYYKHKKGKLDKGMKKISKKVKIISLVSGVFLIALIAGVCFFYEVHWYNATTVNGIDVSSCSLKESKKRIEEAFSNYTLQLKGREKGKLSINKGEIDFQLEVEKELQDLYDKQHETFFLFHIFNRKEVDCTVSYSKKKLDTIIKKSELVKGSKDYKIANPENAYLKYSKEDGALEIVPEVYGNKVVIAKLSERVEEALVNLDEVIDLTENGEAELSYKIPSVKKDSEALVEQMERYNQIVNHWIVWDMGEGQQEVVSPDMIYHWISFNKKKQLVVDKDKVQRWVSSFCAKYRTVGATRKLKTHSGRVIELSDGDYGWIIDYNKTVEKLTELIKKKRKQESIDAYLADTSEENKKKLTDKVKPIYLASAFKKDYKNFSNDWDPKNYVEVSISEQKVYIWKNGKCVFETRCITGRPVKDRKTKTGTYYIKEHMLAKTLIGEDYKTPVKYWTRIMWSGTGFHSATWQNWGKWTKDYYKTRGSHGCINLSMQDAQRVYELTKSFEAVFIYE